MYANSQAPILKVTEARYEKTYGHKLSHLFRRGIVAGGRIKKQRSVLQSSFELSRKAWSDSLDMERLEDQPILENVRILKDRATTQIAKDNLPALDEETIPSTLWLQREMERINNKPSKNLTDILTTHLKNRLDHHLKAVLMTPPTRAPESKTATLRKFINSTASSTLNILKLKTDAAEERILTTARKALEESNPSLVTFEENLGSEIIKRNQSSNSHLDNRLLRLRHKLKYDSLLTNKKLFDWKIINSEVCKFCGIDTEDMEHLLNDCEILKPLWDIVEERTLTCWRVKMSQLDKFVGSRLDGAGKRKAENFF